MSPLSPIDRRKCSSARSTRSKLNDWIDSHEDSSGQALILLALLIALLLPIVGIGLLVITDAGNRAAARAAKVDGVLYAMQSGVEYAAAMLMRGIYLGGPLPAEVNDATVSIAVPVLLGVEAGTEIYEVAVTARAGPIVRGVEAELEIVPGVSSRIRSWKEVPPIKPRKHGRGAR